VLDAKFRFITKVEVFKGSLNESLAVGQPHVPQRRGPLPDWAERGTGAVDDRSVSYNARNYGRHIT
jgi:hypothetical protein